MAMKIGACRNYLVSLEEFPEAADFVEVAAWDLYDLEQSKIDELRRAVEAGCFRTYSANGLFPRDLRLTGDVDWGKVRDYCALIFDRLAQIGVSMVVFGSGKAKHVPDGFPMEKAWEQLYELGAILSDTAAQYGQTVVVEPLSYSEVNIVNTYEDAVRYCRAVNRDNFKALVDFYHFDNNKEDFATIEQNKEFLYHTHIATPVKRSRPETEEEWAFFKKCISFLHKIGYQNALSFEGGAHDTEQFNAMLSEMKAFYRSIL